MGCLVVLGIPALCFYIGYVLGVRGGRSLGYKFIIDRKLDKDYEDWVRKHG